MKRKIVLAALLLSALAMAGTNRNPTEYPVNVHVIASRMVVYHTYFQRLNVLIDGKKYELESLTPAYGVLMLGDYKARVRDDGHRAYGHKSAYDSWQVYEVLLPDNKTRQFVVMEIVP
ncbi:MAG: hypothetical protein HY010_00220 [Acidobacteria bacterium]|nr:hypothetical protein [Acidobacteriota bacterium]